MMAAPPARGPSMSESASDIELPSLPRRWAGRVKSTSAVASSVSRLVSAMVVTARPAAGAGHARSVIQSEHVSDFGIVCGPSDSVRLAKSIFVNRFLKSLLLAFWSRFLDFYLSGNIFPMFGAVLVEF